MNNYKLLLPLQHVSHEGHLNSIIIETMQKHNVKGDIMFHPHHEMSDEAKDYVAANRGPIYISGKPTDVKFLAIDEDDMINIW